MRKTLDTTLPRLVAKADPGERVSLTIWRDGETRKLDVTLGSQDSLRTASATPDHEPESAQLKPLGLALAPMTDELRAELGLPETGGVIVTEVSPGGPAVKQGLRAGDVIVALDGTEVSSADQVKAALQAKGGENGQAVLLRVNRDGETLFVGIRLEKA